MKKETKIITSGNVPSLNCGSVNPPIYQTSTVLFPTLEDYDSSEKGKICFEGVEDSDAVDYSYGLTGTPTTFALQNALKDVEGGDDCVITSSGLSAITSTLLALLRSGDHLLMVDNVYGPTRRFCNKNLKK